MTRSFVGWFLSSLFFFYPHTVWSEVVTNWDNGPIEMRDQHPLALMHLSAVTESPEVVGKYELAGRTSYAWSNTINRRKGSYLIDAESRVVDLTLRYGLTENVEAQLLVPVVYRGEGILDPLLDGWHKILGLPRGKRDKVDDNGYSLAGENNDGSEFDLTDAGTQLGNIALGVKSLFSAGSKSAPAWAGSVRLSLPTAHDSFGHESIDLGVQLLGSKRWDDLSSYWGASYIYYSDHETDNLRFQHHRFAGFLGSEYRLFTWLQVYIGTLVENALLDGVEKFPDYSVYLDTGITIPVAQDWKIEVLFRENPAPRDGTVDATGLLALSYRNIL